ncbi:hypothetical protein N7470_007982 [Penicillium chermesinum]|nr:hypothetical protein N7470_007982 [Penicillium chermesinum]
MCDVSRMQTKRKCAIVAPNAETPKRARRPERQIGHVKRPKPGIKDDGTLRDLKQLSRYFTRRAKILFGLLKDLIPEGELNVMHPHRVPLV